MLAILSPAKALDYETKPVTAVYTLPDMLKESETLIKKLRTLSEKKLSDLMGISPNLAQLNYKRYANWHPNFTVENAKQAVLAFNGEAFNGLNAESYSKKDFDYAQQHLRILSGLHGLLRPLDLVQPYRLEMGSKLALKGKKNLYEYWGDKITQKLNDTLEEQGDTILVNLASNEYFKSVNTKKLKARVIACSFKDFSNGQYKTVMVYAKKARGYMASYLIKNRIQDINDLKGFDTDGYCINEPMSTENNLVFTRG